MENITLFINGKGVSCPTGSSLLEAAELNGIKIPRLCYHPELKPLGGCRLCLVEDEKTGKILASCVMPASPNMSILTDTPRINRHRRNIVRLMMAEHPESCIVCNKGNRCQLRQIAAQLGLGQTGLYHMPNYKPIEQANPFIIRDLTKCVLCGKCIRADHELVQTGAIDYNFRGFKSRPLTLHDLPLEQSNCTFCGTCVSICPTGALAPKNLTHAGTPERESDSVCGFCGVGCSLTLGVIGKQIVETNPSHLPETLNGATLCVRGHFAHDFLNAEQRLTQPLMRAEDKLAPVSWNEAVNHVASRLLEIKKTFGPQSIGFLGSSKCTNEENYLFQKIARTVLETNNVDNGGYLSGRSCLDLIDSRTGGGWRVSPLSNLEKAESIVVIGADPGNSAPVVGYYIRRTAKKGIPMIVVDPRRTDLVPFSTVWLRILPERDLQLINCLAALLWKRFGHDTGFIDRFTENFTKYSEGLSSFNHQRLCVEAGVDMISLERVVELLKGKKIAFVIGHGILQQRNAARAADAILNLMLMTGSLGTDTGGLYLLARENNQAGALDMGSAPDLLPGRENLGDSRQRQRFERAWEVRLSPDQGLNAIRMITEAEKGTLKALYIMGENPLRSLPQPERVLKALQNLEFLVVQDILKTETSTVAHVVLPGASFSEKAGSYTNMEGRIQCVEPVVSPPLEARPDWMILDMVSEKMGRFTRYDSLEKIRAEIVRHIPEYQGLSNGKKTFWINNTSKKGLFQPDGQGEPISFFPVAFAEDRPHDDNYPFTAILGSTRFHLGSGTRTSHSKRIGNFGKNGHVEISPSDGLELNLVNGDRIRIQSRHGSIERELILEKGLAQGLVLAPIGFEENDAMKLLPLTPFEDRTSRGLKTCQVRIDKIQ
ncbi:NADH-quinone oxidoreductase subunit 3-like protein (Nqo3/NuoG) [uncultured Desulfobacterium sp.]|uniref:NADH-quinone oxidoreductase subunit 3-like protein (Nqo3/NuoG) n=1 Tax=uncultured Desulfobacterium sp. TaxID=201089 RepID=A0A445MR58_9BACT|nr:NADH-quinone oxidoreductase subunit 3-like protein (Nqo3/NuoG) [uncultured Desulfobacterium sp.]